jgi:imidazole glycerol-phosphate synthase subunit HisH
VIAIIDYDIGNLAAVSNMLQRLGASSVITADAESIARADRIILPGNGHFDACMKNLRSSGLIPLLEQRVLRDEVPLLGICVGAQMLGRGSEEGVESGLGWIPMSVKRFPALPGLRVPHMGWNHIAAGRDGHVLKQGLGADARFYFVHSYFMQPDFEEDVLFKSEYGVEFSSGVCRGNISGVQFHPEKSHRFGKRLLGNFVVGM